MNSFRNIVLALGGLLSAAPALAGIWQNNFTSVPVDSPWALAGLATIVALISFRLLRKKK